MLNSKHKTTIIKGLIIYYFIFMEVKLMFTRKPKKQVLIVGSILIAAILLSGFSYYYFSTLKGSKNVSYKSYSSKPSSSKAKKSIVEPSSTAKQTATAPITSAISTSKSPASTTASISDDQIRQLLHDGDFYLRNFIVTMYKSHIDEDFQKTIDGRSFVKLIPPITNYNFLKNFIYRDYAFTSYYSDDLTRYIMDQLFVYINGTYYIGYGNLGIAFKYDNTFKVISRNYSGNTLTIEYSGHFYDKSLGCFNATLSFNGSKWVLSKFDPWGLVSPDPQL